MGILTVADRYEARDRLRLLHALQPPVPAQIDARFVLCNVTGDEHRILVALEIMLYHDIIVLNCSENMNSGKTYAYFSALPELLSGEQEAPTTSPSGGSRGRTCTGATSIPPARRTPLHEGMGYVLSWDLVRWIASTNVTRNNTAGPEDALVGEWLRAGGRGKNVYSTQGARLNYDDTKPVMYDFPYPPWSFVPNTIAVHRLKDRKKWATTLRYFNATRGLKPSKFYHLLN
ncbi:unnamed protein product [Spirodela intermedia]|uniref:Hexosyltransferase n=1 Tax=Spirodela intermedia TaxID=51605 RepID=A0A7I8IWF4_SPIIN|nr:unnamed protein product [Spirodela intermedia]CAA6662308.1 unnamed protein product [Spirodela intermedia]